MARTALHRLTQLLRAAHAGERAAAFAYQGHARSLRDSGQREDVARIEREEWEHRHRLGEMLDELGQRPARLREALFATIGRVLSALCHVSGWFLPMYGAGWIEARNVQEYVDAAAMARTAHHDGYARELLQMAACEREHEAYFRGQVAAAWQTRFIGLWVAPAPAPAPAPVITAPAPMDALVGAGCEPTPGMGR